ncbi:MAG: MarR family winged helix-turn-helix transcriptional regulator [Acidimicrobiales bacterium]
MTPPTTEVPANETAVALRVAVARIHRALRSRAERQLTASQSSALARIEQEGPVRLGVLAQLEGVTAATMSKVVDALAERSLIERVADAADGRASLVRLSDDGAATLQKLRAASNRAISAALAELDALETASLSDALPVLEHLAELLTGAPGA